MSIETLVSHAADLARKLHAGQRRKSSGEPVFLAHLAPVSELVAAYGGSPEAIAAALLHDAIEDCDPDVRPMILGTCGPDVLALVEECTEPGTGLGKNQKAPWKERKDGYLLHLRTASNMALLISLSDKTQQVEELAGNYHTHGDDVYKIFKVGKEQTLWFFQELSDTYHKHIYSPDFERLLVRFDQSLFALEH